jgi:hypothetical protein
MNILYRIRKFFQPKLGNVLNSFNKAVVKLEKVMANEAAEVAARTAAIAQHNASIATSQAIIVKAQTVHQNLNALLGNN